MSELSTPIDGAIVAFLVRILDRFEATIADPATLLASLQGLGLDAATVTAYQAYIAARASDVAKLSTDLPALLDQLASGSPDLVAMIAPAQELWSVAAGIVHDAPPALPGADVIGQLLTTAIDRAVREASTAIWAALSATGFLGPGRSLLTALDQALGDPLQYVWQVFDALRREDTLSIAGVLTGPRVISMSSVPLGADEPGASAFPDAIVLQRAVLKLAADTYGDAIAIQLDLLATKAVPPAFVAVVLSTGALAAPVNLGSLLQLSLDPFNAPFAIALTGFGAVKQIAGDSPKLTLAATVPSELSFGSPGDIRLSLQQPVLEATIAPDAWGATLGITTFELTIPKASAGSLLGIFLPSSGIVLRGKLLLKIDDKGLHFDGGVGLSATWPDVVHLPGVTIHSLTTSAGRDGATVSLSAKGTVVVSLGPVTVTIEGFGIDQPLRLTTDGSGNLGLVDLQAPSFAMPTGLGIAIDASVIKGGGFLRVTDTQIAGALELSLALGSLELSIQAFGSIEEVNGAVSFIVIMSVTFSPPIEIFLGLTLNAVGGAFGFNRTVDTVALRGVVRDGHAKDLLIPDDLIARANQILAAVASVFPPKRGQYVAAPILQLGWGRPISLVTMTAGVVFTFPNPLAIVIVGELRIAMPSPTAPVIDLRADFAGVIDRTTGNVSVDASLARSKIGTFDIAGDIALRGGPQGFVFSAGGFHPQFTPPADLNDLRRLSIAISPSPLLKIHAECYFAVTANSRQFGAAMFLEAKLGPLGAKGHLSLDTLIRTEPRTHFTATISGALELTVGTEELATLDVDVLLEGPGHWHAVAHASISFFLFSISGTLDLAWGTDPPIDLGPPVDIAQLVLDALADDAAWRHVLPAADAGLAQLRAGADALHPLGLLRLTQTVAPLAVAIEKFGSSALASTDPVTVTVTASGAVVTPAQELFATSDFFAMSDEDRLAKPAFLPFAAGETITGSAWQVSDPQAADIVYEESLGDASKFRPLDGGALGWTQLGAAGRARGPIANPTAPRVAVVAPTYAIADAGTGAIVSTGAASAMVASTHRSVDTIAVADFEPRRVG